jgi:hypothetical protein
MSATRRAPGGNLWKCDGNVAVVRGSIGWLRYCESTKTRRV